MAVKYLFRFSFIILLLGSSFFASLFMILESAEFYRGFYDADSGLDFGLWAAALNEVFLIIMAAVWLPSIQTGKRSFLHPGNLLIKLILILLFVNTVGGATLNVVRETLNQIQEEENRIALLNTIKEQADQGKESLSAFIDQNQRVNTALAAKNLNEINNEIRELEKNRKSTLALWVDILTLFVLRLTIQLANITCVWLASWLYRQPISAAGIFHSGSADRLKDDLRESWKLTPGAGVSGEVSAGRTSGHFERDDSVRIREHRIKPDHPVKDSQEDRVIESGIVNSAESSSPNSAPSNKASETDRNVILIDSDDANKNDADRSDSTELKPEENIESKENKADKTPVINPQPAELNTLGQASEFHSKDNSENSFKNNSGVTHSNSDYHSNESFQDEHAESKFDHIEDEGLEEAEAQDGKKASEKALKKPAAGHKQPKAISAKTTGTQSGKNIRNASDKTTDKLNNISDDKRHESLLIKNDTAFESAQIAKAKKGIVENQSLEGESDFDDNNFDHDEIDKIEELKDEIRGFFEGRANAMFIDDVARKTGLNKKTLSGIILGQGDSEYSDLHEITGIYKRLKEIWEKDNSYI